MKFLFLCPDHFYLHLHHLIATPFKRSPNRGSFARVASERDGNMLFAAPPIVRRIECTPTRPRHEHFTPGMGRHRPDEPFPFTVLSPWRRCLDVAAHVAGGQACCSQDTQHDMSEILADTDAIPPDRGHIR